MRARLQPVETASRPLDSYAPYADGDSLARIRAAAAPLAGARVLHISAAAPGGRVPDQLHALLPLVRDCGLAVSWQILSGDREFTTVGEALRNGLQGAETAIGDGAFEAYLAAAEDAARRHEGAFDAVVVHGPDSLGAARAADAVGGRWVFRAHVDASRPDPAAWARADELLGEYGVEVYPLERFAPPERESERVRAIAPALDPLSPRHRGLPLGLSGDVLRSLGLDLSRPLCAMVGLDRWKDPHEVIDAFELAKAQLDDLQLALAGVLSGDTPDDWALVAELTDYAAGRDDIHVLTNHAQVGNVELNALRRIARVCVHRTLREGFGLAVSEALWMGTPVIAGATGGVPEQLADGEAGFLTGPTSETAARIVQLVSDPAHAIELGQAGQERVRERFLVPRLLEDELALLAATLSGPDAGGGNDPATV